MRTAVALSTDCTLQPVRLKPPRPAAPGAPDATLCEADAWSVRPPERAALSFFGGFFLVTLRAGRIRAIGGRQSAIGKRRKRTSCPRRTRDVCGTPAGSQSNINGARKHRCVSSQRFFANCWLAWIPAAVPRIDDARRGDDEAERVARGAHCGRGYVPASVCVLSEAWMDPRRISRDACRGRGDDEAERSSRGCLSWVADGFARELLPQGDFKGAASCRAGMTVRLPSMPVA